MIAAHQLQPEPEVIAELLSNNLRVSHEPSNRLALTIRYSHPDPELAMEVANSVANHYVDYNKRLRLTEYMNDVETLRGLADSQREKVKVISARIDQFKEQDEKRPFIDEVKICERLGKLVVDKKTAEASMSELKNIDTAEYRDAQKAKSEIELEIAQLEALLLEKGQRLIDLHTLKRNFDVQNSFLGAYEEHMSRYRAIIGPFNPRYPRVHIAHEGSIE